MSDIESFSVKIGSAYGKLPPEFSLELTKVGYFSVSGLNNAGKSTVLQWLFSQIGDSIYVPAERGIVQPSVGSGTGNLNQYVSTFRTRVQGGPLDVLELGHRGASLGSNIQFREMDSYTECLLPSMMRDKGITDSITELRRYVKDFSLGENVRDQNDSILIDGRPITQLGTGARSLLMIIIALIHPNYQTVLIDEPELFLEPRAQKALRDMLVEKSTEKRVVVATHSHLLLNRQESQYDHNFYFDGELAKSGMLNRASDKNDLRSLTFRLLGASFDDLMLPENYLVVEGGSDSIIMTKVLQLINPSKAAKVQVAFAQGIQNVAPSINAIAEMIRPYYAEDSVYKGRVVGLVDEPINSSEERSVGELEHHLNNGSSRRLYKLGVNAAGEKLDLEKAIPDAIYSRAGRDKAQVVAEIERLKSVHDHKALGTYKEEVAVSLASVLVLEDLDLEEMKVFKAAAVKAIEPIN